MEYHELLKVCETVEINVTNEMAIAVEKATRNQSNSKLWFKNRADRITASRMKAVCHTDAANPVFATLNHFASQANKQIGAANMKNKQLICTLKNAQTFRYLSRDQSFLAPHWGITRWSCCMYMLW